MNELNLTQMEEINGGLPADVGCVLDVLLAGLSIWSMGAVLAGAAAGGPVGAIGAATLILGPAALASAVIACS